MSKRGWNERDISRRDNGRRDEDEAVSFDVRWLGKNKEG